MAVSDFRNFNATGLMNPDGPCSSARNTRHSALTQQLDQRVSIKLQGQHVGRDGVQCNLHSACRVGWTGQHDGVLTGHVLHSAMGSNAVQYATG